MILERLPQHIGELGPRGSQASSGSGMSRQPVCISYQFLRCFMRTDLLSFTVGEKMDIRIPGCKGHSFRNLSPLFFTANQPLTLKAGPVEDQLKKTKAMEERFVTRIWPRALPEQDRRPDFPQCGRCCANFVLSLDAFWHSNHAS